MAQDPLIASDPQLKILQASIDKAAEAAADAALAYAAFEEVKGGNMAIDRQGKITHILEIDKPIGGKPTGKTLTGGELTQAIAGFRAEYIKRFHADHNINDPRMFPVIQEKGLGAMTSMMDKFAEGARKEAPAVLENAKIAMAKRIQAGDPILKPMEQMTTRYQFGNLAQSDYETVLVNPVGRWLDQKSLPRFKEPTPEVNQKVQPFLDRLAGRRSPDEGDLGSGPAALFAKAIKDNPELLSHYVEYKGEKTHLVKLLLEDATDPTKYHTKETINELKNPNEPRRDGGVNYYPWAQLVKNMATTSPALAKAAFDPQLATKKGEDEFVFLGEQIVKLSLEKGNADLVADLISSGLTLRNADGRDNNLLSYLKPDKTDQASFGKIADALIKRQGADRELDYDLLVVTLERQDYGRAADMIKAGYPLNSADEGAPNISDLLRKDVHIPVANVTKLSQALKERLEHMPNKVSQELLSRLHAQEKQFQDIYHPQNGLPDALLRRSEQLALAEAYHVVTHTHAPPLFGGGNIGALLDNDGLGVVIMGFAFDPPDPEAEKLKPLNVDPKTGKPQNVNPEAEKPFRPGKPVFHRTSGARFITRHTAHLPIDAQIYESGDHFLAEVAKEEKAENTAKTPIGSILLDTQKRYNELAAQHGKEQALTMMQQSLDEQLAAKRKEYDIPEKHWNILQEKSFGGSWDITNPERGKQPPPQPRQEAPARPQEEAPDAVAMKASLRNLLASSMASVQPDVQGMSYGSSALHLPKPSAAKPHAKEPQGIGNGV